MDFSYLFEPYDNLVTKADQAFQRMEGEFAESVKCKRRCSDCCHAVFGLFLIESVFLKQDFDQLDDAERNAALERCGEADRELEILERTLKTFEDDPQMVAYSMAKARIRCPLLSDNEDCVLYPDRPITCRVYGIPTLIRGVPRVCGQAGFKKQQSYPTFNLDGTYRQLFDLSKELLAISGEKDPEKASLLISVSKVIQTPVEELIDEISGGSDIIV
jgi:Fe-S-cluster containining protein